MLAAVLGFWNPIVEGVRESIVGRDVPAPDYRELVGDDYWIQRERSVDLDGEGEDERVRCQVPRKNTSPT